MQRLQGVNAELVTDLQFARSEAVSRNRLMRFAFDSTGLQIDLLLHLHPETAGKHSVSVRLYACARHRLHSQRHHRGTNRASTGIAGHPHLDSQGIDRHKAPASDISEDQL